MKALPASRPLAFDYNHCLSSWSGWCHCLPVFMQSLQLNSLLALPREAFKPLARLLFVEWMMLSFGLHVALSLYLRSMHDTFQPLACYSVAYASRVDDALLWTSKPASPFALQLLQLTSGWCSSQVFVYPVKLFAPLRTRWLLSFHSRTLFIIGLGLYYWTFT